MKPDPVKIIVDRILVIQNALRFGLAFEGLCGDWRVIFHKTLPPMVTPPGSNIPRALKIATRQDLTQDVETLLTYITADEFLAGLAEVVQKQAKFAYEEERFAWVQQRRYRSMYSFYNGLAESVKANRGGVTVGKEKYQAPELPERPEKE